MLLLLQEGFAEIVGNREPIADPTKEVISKALVRKGTEHTKKKKKTNFKQIVCLL